MNLIRQILVVLCMKDDEADEAEEESIVRINPKIFFEGFEEAIDLGMLLSNKEYTQVLKVLQTTKTALGRLQDQDFQPFHPFYEHLGKIFMLHHRFGDTRPGLQRRHYQGLAQMFNSELGMTQAKVRAEIGKITNSEMEEMSVYFEPAYFNKFIGLDV